VSQPLSGAWRNSIGAINIQGQPFGDNPISESGNYYGFLSKVDLDQETNLYDVLFEVVSKEWMDNALMSRPVSIPSLLPPSPALLYHIRGVPEATILKTLGLTTADDMAEGSWYLLGLSKSPPKLAEGDVAGDLYDPDLDTIGPG
jgi:hypothetical protein